MNFLKIFAYILLIVGILLLFYPLIFFELALTKELTNFFSVGAIGSNLSIIFLGGALILIYFLIMAYYLFAKTWLVGVDSIQEFIEKAINSNSRVKKLFSSKIYAGISVLFLLIQLVLIFLFSFIIAPSVMGTQVGLFERFELFLSLLAFLSFGSLFNPFFIIDLAVIGFLTLSFFVFIFRRK